ncbi:gamma-glutamylcyclotransferase [Sarcoptes scabiei]|nr:gamma-glutamylcyclotransferase [Sarcoptes scabiei]
MSDPTELSEDYKFALDKEINHQNRKCDAIRSQLLQLIARQDTVPSAVYRLRFADLLQEYSNEVDDSSTVNGYFSLAKMISKRESLRNCEAKNWRCLMKKRLDEGETIADILPTELVPSNLIDIARKFKQYNSKRIIHTNKVRNQVLDSVQRFDSDDENLSLRARERSPVANVRKGIIDSVRECDRDENSNRKNIPIKGSPTRVPGIFKKRSQHNNFTQMLFATTSSQSYTSEESDSSQKNYMETVSDHKLDQNGQKTSSTEMRKKSFMTGLEKHLIDKIEKNDIDKSQAKEIIEEIRREKPKKFNDPTKKSKIDSLTESSQTNSNQDEDLKEFEPAMIEMIKNTIVKNSSDLDWSTIAGLDYAKNKIQQIAILPLKRPDLFTGIRSPPKGILLFGPPGTGKTMIGRCIAAQANATFFSITSSTLTSKWIGDGEKAMKAMFYLARCQKPSVIFIDEIDSLLKSRSDSEHESSRRMKTEFLSQFDGLSNNVNDGFLVIGTTNRPQELDEAVRRRFAAKLYIPLPEKSARKQMIIQNLRDEKHSLTETEIEDLAEKTQDYSGSDIKHLCREAAMYSFKEIIEDLSNIEKGDIRAINNLDFLQALNTIKPSLSTDDLQEYENWNKRYGSNN